MSRISQISPRRLRAKYTYCTNQRFVQWEFRPCRVLSASGTCLAPTEAERRAKSTQACPFMPDAAVSLYTDAEASTHNGRKRHPISKKGAMTIVRNSFIQMSKLTNLKGRINYISSPARQENLYAVCETTDRKFWRELARCNQEEFSKSGASGTCIEARELIIA